MDICKNAIEYQRELERLLSNCNHELRQKEPVIKNRYKELMDSAEGMEWKTLRIKRDNEISDLYHECMKPVLDFEGSQPKKPIYIYKKARRYYKHEYNWATGEMKISKLPSLMQFLIIGQKEWILKVSFNGTAFDIVPCQNCKKEFTRFYPHEKYCLNCQRRSPKSKKPPIDKPKIRDCRNPDCNKPIPGFRRADAIYCCDACKTAASKKRKNID